MKTTNAQLQAIVDRINRTTGNPLSPYADGKSAVGCYHLDHAYGGVALYQMDNESGGCRDVLQCGHTTKGNLADLMFAFIRGLEAAQTVNA